MKLNCRVCGKTIERKVKNKRAICKECQEQNHAEHMRKYYLTHKEQYKRNDRKRYKQHKQIKRKTAELIIEKYINGERLKPAEPTKCPFKLNHSCTHRKNGHSKSRSLNKCNTSKWKKCPLIKGDLNERSPKI